MATYPGFVWDGSAWQPIGSQVADMSPYALATGTNIAGFGAWASYTPTFAWSGNSFTWSVSGVYALHGKTCYLYANATITGGSAGSPGGALSLTLPVTAKSAYSLVGVNAQFLDSGTQWYAACTTPTNTTTVYVSYIGSNGALPGANASLPMVWAVGDGVYIGGTYEVA